MKTERQPIIKRGVADTARPHASLPTVCAACVEERDHLEAIKRQHDAERESWAKEKALMARQHSAEVKRGNDLERQLALATNRKGGDAEEMTAVKKRLFAANAEAKKTEARFNAQESRHRLELREREVATLRASNDADRRAAEATARALEAEGAVAAARAVEAEGRIAAAEAERDTAVGTMHTATSAMQSLERKFAAVTAASRAAQEDALLKSERQHSEHLERVAFYEDRITRLEQEKSAEKENGLIADEVFKKLADFRIQEIREKGRHLTSLTTQDQANEELQ